MPTTRPLVPALLLAVLTGAAPAAEPKIGNDATDAWGSHVTAAGDGMYPASPAAATAFSFDARSFLQRGQPTYLAAATMHYPRIPAALWRDRLTRIKRGGFTAVETYLFWNFHEEREGTFDFTGDRDVVAFIKTAQEVGLQVFVRVGPYVCAEWSEGGFPSWLRGKPGLRLRQDEPQFMAAMERWFDVVLPKLAPLQASKGGPIVLFQLENEHPNGGGTSANAKGKPYFDRMLAKARACGLEMPMFVSGMHHAHDPAGDRPWDPAGRESPWFSSEFWSGWYDKFGPSDAGTFRQKDRATWKMAAFGGTGYSLYMTHGGSNFAGWNNEELSASYDFGAPIGQTGDLRPLYFALRRANGFATGFIDILRQAATTEAVERPEPGLKAWQRTSPAGTVLFLDNPGQTAIEATLDGGDQVRIAPGEIAPFLSRAAVDPRFTVERSSAPVLGRVASSTGTILLVEVPDQGVAHLTLTSSAAIRSRGGAQETGLVASDGGRRTDLALTAEATPRIWILESDGRRLTVIAGTRRQGERIWPVGTATAPAFLVDAAYPREWDGARDTALCEGPAANARLVTATTVTALRDGGAVAAGDTAQAAATAPALGAWSGVPADRQASPTWNDQGWTAAADPQQLGLGGGTASYGWYRSAFTQDAPVDALLRLDRAADRCAVFLDGKLAGNTDREHPEVTLALGAGRHVLAVLAGHSGRDKLFFNLGIMSEQDPKGLFGAPALMATAAATATLDHWRFRRLDDREGRTLAAAEGPDTTGPAWADAADKQDLFNREKGYALAISQFDGGSGELHELRFGGIDDEAVVWCNGVRLGEHKGWNSPFVLAIPPTLVKPSGNTVAVFIRNTDQAGGFNGPVTYSARTYLPGRPDGRLHDWRQQDLTEAPPTSGWVPPLQLKPGSPAFFRTSFTFSAGIPEAALRLGVGGLSHGFVWVNGHHLGRHPDRLSPNGLWLPPNWLKATGSNEIVIFDEQGRDPGQVRLAIDAGSAVELHRLAGR